MSGCAGADRPLLDALYVANQQGSVIRWTIIGEARHVKSEEEIAYLRTSEEPPSSRSA